MNQIEWEEAQRELKLERVSHRLQSSMDRGYITQTPVGHAIIKQQVAFISEELIASSYKKTRGMGGVYAQTFRAAATHNGVEDWDRMAYIGLYTTLDCIFSHGRKKNLASSIARKIGHKLEDDHKLETFSKDNAGWHFLIKKDLEKADLKGRQIREIQSLKRRWETKGNEWTPWGIKVVLHTGMRILRVILAVMNEYFTLKDVVISNKKDFLVKTTPLMDSFIEEFTEYLLQRTTSTVPCIEKPIDWRRNDDGSITGGFHSMELTRIIPYIRTKTTAQRDYILDHNPAAHISACNTLQNTQWRINPDALEFLKESIVLGMMPEHVPPLEKYDLPDRPEDDSPHRKQWGKDASKIYKLNAKNAQKLLQIQRVFSLTTALKDKPFWFVYNTDFRGRILCCSSHLNPQGPDYVRGLLQFSHGKPLGKNGFKWLAVHGANCYGYNKVSYTDRVKWIMDNVERIREAAIQPFSSSGSSFIRESKNPFQFYAFACEWNRLCDERLPETFISHLPVTLDGSCNGFQHISALLRDENGAARVNLIDRELPEDLYRDIADQLQTVLTKHDNYALGIEVSRMGITRERVKQVVLAVPYGMTIRGASLAIQEAFTLTNWDVITHVTACILEVIDQLMPAHRELKLWLQALCDIEAGQDRNLSWISPVGFPIMQPYTLHRQESIKTDLLGTKTFTYRDEVSGVMNSKARVSITPNFIHSLDASHLVKTINTAAQEGMTDFMVIHDSFATYAADTEEFHHIIREEFYDLYAEDVLLNFQSQFNNTPEKPTYGTYQSRQALTASYLFG